MTIIGMRSAVEADLAWPAARVAAGERSGIRCPAVQAGHPAIGRFTHARGGVAGLVARTAELPVVLDETQLLGGGAASGEDGDTTQGEQPQRTHVSPSSRGGVNRRVTLALQSRGTARSRQR
jgi:hypothetical protein